MKKKSLLLICIAILATVIFGGVASATGGFKIHKIDDNGDPVEGAVFDVYGKPEVSWAEDPVIPASCEHDPPVQKAVTAAEGSELPSEVGPFGFTMKAAEPSFPMVPGSENGEKTLEISAQAPYEAGSGSVVSAQDGSLLLSVEFGTITFTEAGVYDYTITENDNGDPAYAYDENVYTVRYEVTDNNGQLEAVRTFYKNGAVVADLSTILFENVYTEPAQQEYIDISGKKIWDDANDQDGKRPASVTLRLHADGKEVEKVAVNGDSETADGTWNYTFKDLPKYREGHIGESGQEIVYTVTEDATEDYQAHYKSTKDGFDITNSYTPGKTEVTVSKHWEDADDQDGIRPESVTVKLLAEGEATDETLTLGADNNWEGTFTVDEYKAGKKIVYTVVETDGEKDLGDGDATSYGYDVNISGNATTGYTITNTHEPETVEIEVEKKWMDDGLFDAEGKPIGEYKRPEKVTVVLTDQFPENEEDPINELGRVELSADASGAWKGVIKDLPKYADGEEIAYKDHFLVEPETPDGFAYVAYKLEKGDDGNYTGVVENIPIVEDKYTPVEVKLLKYSEARTIPADPDTEEPRDVPLPGVKFSVTEKGAESEAPQTLTTDEEGKATFTVAEPGKKLVVKETETREGYHNNGATFTLGVEEGELESITFDADAGEWVATYGLYTEVLAQGKSPEDLTIETPPLSDPDGNYHPENEDTYILRNTPLATLVVEKYFNGAGMRTYEEAPKEFAITLSYTDAAGNAQEKKLTADPNGEYWYSGGNPSLCRWLVPGIPYNAEVTVTESGFDKQGYALDHTEAFVWRMDPNAPRYESDMADGAQISTDKRSITFHMPAHFDPDPAWKYSEEYGGESLGLLGARVRFQNHYYSTETTDITGTKSWIDGGRTHDNANEVALTLYRRASGNVADAEQVAGATPTWDGNTYTFASQPVYDRSGNRYVYWVIEERVEGYDAPKHTSVEGDATSEPGAPNGGLITNELSQDYVEITVTKQWDDASDQDGKRPDDLTLALYRTGKDGDETYTGKVNSGEVKVEKSGDTWTYTFTRDNGAGSAPGHLKYDSGRNEFIYEVREEAVPEGYMASYADASGNAITADTPGVPNGGTITNTHTPETITISGTKTWDDADNQDGIRPTSVTVNLLADGEKVDSKTVSGSDDWKYSFTNLPKYKNGKEIVYTVTEEAVEGYTAEVDGFNITNTHTPETTTVSGTKTWDDADNQDGKRPASIIVKVMDGTTEVARKTVKAEDDWKYQFNDLPKYKAGEEIKYTVEENAVSGYTTTVDGFNIKNTHTPEKISVILTKTWDDASNQDGKRRTADAYKSFLTLKANDTPVTTSSSAVDNSDNTYTVTWANLDKYANGSVINYTIEETAIDGYTASEISGSAAEGFKITNTHTPETTTISGTKIWDDDNDRDGKRPESVTVRLHADGTVVDTKTVSADASGNWKYEFADKPKFRDGGHEIVYTVTEDSTENYQAHYTSTADGFNITNKYIPGKMEVSVEKHWDDADNQDGIRPDKVTVKLLANGAATGKTVELSDANSWEAEFTDLYVMEAGSAITYTVEEDTDSVITGTDGVGTYACAVSGNATEGFVVTNKHTPEKITISGTKNWPGEPMIGWTVPDSITVKLQKKDGDTWTDVTSKTVSEDATTGEWTYSFENQPKYNAGVEIEYRVVEEPVAGYTASGGTATDNYNLTNEYDSRTLTLTKTWAGDSALPAGTRPDILMFSSYLELYRDGEKWDGLDAPMPQVVDNNNSTYTVTYTVPRTNEQGTDIEYTIKETDILNYAEGTVTGNMENGFAVTNTAQTRSISVEKVWKDSGYESNRPPLGVQIILYADGVDAEKEIVLNDSNNWKGTFENLLKYKNGEEIQYTVKENTPLGTIRTRSAAPGALEYKTEVTGNMTDGFVVTNTISGTVNLLLNKTWEDANDQDGLRPLDDLGEPSGNVENGNYADMLRVERKVEGGQPEVVSWTASVMFDFDKSYEVEFKNLPRFDDEGNEYEYSIVELPITGYNTREVEASGDATNGFTLTNTHTPATISISGTKEWKNSDGTDAAPTVDNFTVKLQKSTDGTSWVDAGKSVTVAARTTDTSVTPNIWTFEDLPKYEDGVELQYRCVEDPVPTGWTSTGGTAGDNYKITNTLAAATGGINLNVNFTQINPNLSWIAKTVPVTTEEPAQRTIKVGGEDKEVYMYTYSNPDASNPDAVTYYGDMPYSHSVSQWYDASGNALDSADAGTAALIEALRNSAVLVNEEVTRDVFGGLFKDNITKNITVTGPNGFSKNYSIKLGENSTYQIPITDAGEYTITQELVSSADINQAEFPDPGRDTGYTGIYSIQTAVVNVTKDGDNFICAMDTDKTMVYEHTVNNHSKPYTLTPFEWGDNPYAEGNGYHQGGGTSAEGDTVTINHYMDGVSEQ